MSEIRVKGLAELNRFLQTLPPRLEKNILRGALRAGAQPVAEDARNNAPEDTGVLKAGIKVSTKSRKGVVIASVKLTGKHAYIGRWLEYGVAAHQITSAKGGWLFFAGNFAKAVNHPGIKPRPFMRPALHNKAQDAVVAAAEYMKVRLASKHGLDTRSVAIEADE